MKNKILPLALVAFGLASCTPDPICVDVYSVEADTLEQTLTTNSEGVPFYNEDEAQLYANFIAQSDTTARVLTTTNCD